MHISYLSSSITLPIRGDDAFCEQFISSCAASKDGSELVDVPAALDAVLHWLFTEGVICAGAIDTSSLLRKDSGLQRDGACFVYLFELTSSLYPAAGSYTLLSVPLFFDPAARATSDLQPSGTINNSGFLFDIHIACIFTS
jgi:hypothetical protein